MKKYLNGFFALGLLLFVASAFITGCGKKEEENTRTQVNTGKNDSVAVITAKVEKKQLTMTKVYTGSLEGEKQANIVSQLAERILDIPVKVGQNVSAGQVIIKLDKGGVTSQYFQAKSNLDNIEKNLERSKSLFESGAIARQALDGAQTAYDIAKANFNAAKNAVEITSPISGVVTSIKLNIGDFTSPGQPIITVATISSLKLIMSLGEGDMPYVTTGKKVKVFSELNPAISAKGTISEISRSADLTTRTFQVKASFANVNNSWFKPGMFAKAELDLTTPAEVSVIPRESIVYSDKGPIVYVISQGKAFSRDVKLGLQNDNFIEVVGGLKPDELVARVGMNNLKDGAPVIISTDKTLLSENK